MQSLPIFGSVERIQELRRWVRSEELKKIIIYFTIKNLLEYENADATEFPLLNLHKLVNIPDFVINSILQSPKIIFANFKKHRQVVVLNPCRKKYGL